MAPNEAYELAGNVLDRPDIRILSRDFNERVFGNFIIGFDQDGRQRSLICDRSQILLCNDLGGLSGCVLVVPSLYELAPQELIDFLKAALDA